MQIISKLLNPLPVMLQIRDNIGRTTSFTWEILLDKPRNNSIPTEEEIKQSLGVTVPSNITLCDNRSRQLRCWVILFYDPDKKISVLKTKSKKIEIDDNMRKQAGLTAFLDKKEEPLFHTEFDNWDVDTSVLTFTINIYWIIDIADQFAYGLSVEIKSETDEVREYYFVPDEFNQDISPSETVIETRLLSARVKSTKDINRNLVENTTNSNTSQQPIEIISPRPPETQTTNNDIEIKRSTKILLPENEKEKDNSSDSDDYILDKTFNLKNNPHKVNFDLFDEDFSSPFNGLTKVDEIEVNLDLTSSNIENPFAKEEI